MADKSEIQDLKGKLNEDGLIIPADYVLMKRNFKAELLEFYLNSLKEGQTILDLNPGFDGVYTDIDLSRLQYIAVEQNSHIKSFLKEKNIAVKDWKAPNIPLNDNSIDYVLSAPYIEHLPTYLDALNLLIEIKRVLKKDGRILLIVPNYLNLKSIFYEDYKHGWVTTKKRLEDMLRDCSYDVLGFRYTIGWITMRMNPLCTVLRFAIYLIMAIIRMNPVERFLEAVKLDKLGHKFKKTFFELIVIEARVNKP